MQNDVLSFHGMYFYIFFFVALAQYILECDILHIDFNTFTVLLLLKYQDFFDSAIVVILYDDWFLMSLERFLAVCLFRADVI